MSLAAITARAEAAFEKHFGRAATHRVQAPGRVNLIGEHTDYNDGFVLPCAIDRATVVVARAREDAVLRVVAADAEGGVAVDSFALDAPIAPRSDAPWTTYVRGMAAELAAAGAAPRGLDLAIAGDVPQGAGLSSSASLLVAIGQAFVTVHGSGLDGRRLALMAQRAENGFVGTRCGVMDPLISACGRADHALLIDCRSLDTQAVPLPPGVAVLIAHSMLRRGLAGSAYNERRAACEAAARHFGVAALRDVDAGMLEADRSLDALLARRARHVVGENARTLEAAQALAAGDLPRMGRLMAASHASMRDDFEITLPPIDRLVEIAAQAIGDEGGARMTGGGFGGCVVALVREPRVEAVRKAIAAGYRAPSGERATVHVCRASAGAGPL